MLLEDVLQHYLPRLYHGFEIVSCHAIRVTRDADFGIRRRDEDLIMTIEKGVRERRMGDAVASIRSRFPRKCRSTGGRA